MTRYHVVFCVLLFSLVGCTDTIDSLTREYRNANNEAIDALMMVTDDNSARRMTQRVFKPIMNRYKDIDTKLDIVKANRLKKEMVKEVYESDGFQVYLNELEMNRMRMSMELARLRDLMNKYGKIERARLDEEGKFNVEVNFKDPDVCPNLHDLLTGTDLEVVRQNLVSPKLMDIVSQFPQWKVDIYPLVYGKFMERRKTTFAPQDRKDPVFIH